MFEVIAQLRYGNRGERDESTGGGVHNALEQGYSEPKVTCGCTKVPVYELRYHNRPVNQQLLELQMQNVFLIPATGADERA